MIGGGQSLMWPNQEDEAMAEQEVVFSDFIQEQLEKKIAGLEARKVTAREAIGALHGALTAARDRGVPEAELLKVLREQGIRLTAKVFREYLDAGRPGKHVNAGRAAGAAAKINGGEGSPATGGG